VEEGILVAKKDFNAPGHIDLHKIPNLQVIKACQSLTSRGYVKTQFSWQYYYYTLTNEGIGTSPSLPGPFCLQIPRFIEFVRVLAQGKPYLELSCLRFLLDVIRCWTRFVCISAVSNE
jgi:hypothetical protein